MNGVIQPPCQGRHAASANRGGRSAVHHGLNMGVSAIDPASKFAI